MYRENDTLASHGLSQTPTLCSSFRAIGRSCFLCARFPGHFLFGHISDLQMARILAQKKRTVVGSFQGRPVAYVGINVERDQDPYVAPFMQGTRYTFTPLAESGMATTNAYHVRGEPTNFLIDQQGRIVFTDFSITNAKSERMLTLMIQSMLDHPAPEAARGR